MKSAKRALKAIAGKKRVTYETLLTFVAEAESQMNSRSLTHVSSDCNDLEALTPNHFLMGRASLNISLDVVSDADLCSRKRWKHALVRPKWHREYRDVAEGDLVFVTSDNVPRGRFSTSKSNPHCVWRRQKSS